jgi:hypothetical protein
MSIDSIKKVTRSETIQLSEPSRNNQLKLVKLDQDKIQKKISHEASKDNTGKLIGRVTTSRLHDALLEFDVEELRKEMIFPNGLSKKGPC